MKKNQIVTIYSVFLLDSLSTTCNIRYKTDIKVSVTADTQTSSKIVKKTLEKSEEFFEINLGKIR